MSPGRQTWRTEDLPDNNGNYFQPNEIMDLTQILGCFVLMMGGISLLQLESITFRKIGMAMVWLSSGLAAYFLSGSIVLACTMLLLWVLFPLWEMVFVLRQLRVPRNRQLTDARAPRDEFDELTQMTHDLVELGFEQLDECRLRPTQHEQYYRLFGRADGLAQATIGYIAQGPFGFHFVTFTSRGKDGRFWVTWDYPLTYGLVMPPETAVYRVLHCQDVTELHHAHQDFLKINDIEEANLAPIEPTREAARAQLEQMLNEQIEYNISRGYLAPAKNPEEENFCYSWRGTLYVAAQVLRDLWF